MVFILNKKFINGAVSIPDSVYSKPSRPWAPISASKVERKRVYLRKQKYKRFRILYSYYHLTKYKKKYRRVNIRSLYRKHLQKLVGSKEGGLGVSQSMIIEQKIHGKVLLHVLLRDALIARGRKVYAQNIVDLFCLYLKRIMPKAQPLYVLERVVSLLCPLFAVRTKKVAGQKLKVPLYLKVMRRYFLALRWLIEAAEQRKDGVVFAEKLAKECKDAYNLKGNAFKKRLDNCKEVDESRVNLRFVK